MRQTEGRPLDGLLDCAEDGDLAFRSTLDVLFPQLVKGILTAVWSEHGCEFEYQSKANSLDLAVPCQRIQHLGDKVGDDGIFCAVEIPFQSL